MKFVKVVAAVAIIAATTGCAINWSFEGKSYSSKEAMLEATDGAASSAVAAISPLPSPVSTRALVFVIPSQETMARVSADYHKARTGSAPNAMMTEMLDGITASTYKMLKVYYDGMVRRNIYSAVQLVDADTTMPNPQPSANKDVVFYYETGLGSANWFYATQKSGKQILAVDRTAPTISGKVQAFVEAVQLQAIKD